MCYLDFIPVCDIILHYMFAVVCVSHNDLCGALVMLYYMLTYATCHICVNCYISRHLTCMPALNTPTPD